MSTVNLDVKKLEELYKGKAKTVYATDDAERLILFFRNDTSAFDGKKLAQLDRKGMVNNKFNAFIMQKLQAAGIPTHFEGLLNDQECVVKKLTMLPVECVVRNMAAGSMCRRLGIAEGAELTPPTFEFFLKDDSLGDPMINESHIETFGWASKSQVEQMKVMTFKVNQILKDIFLAGNMLLVDSKLEFGLFNGELVLGDEFSPDGCRLWDKTTREKLDKDRFRQDLGDVVEAYEQVARRIGVPL
ncbi:MAG TPA: phosphoribosylaminoimidazolesuccinocarboxamide synthase [Pseudomonadales bacterium]|nr:phosphoribosylaminoimidazolesuccinocarboxamide synthase [Pseudomonadales bacterium]